MRIETNFNFLMYLILGLVFVLALVKTNIPRKHHKIILTLIVAVTMPAFVPGHGEVIMLLPTGAMFAVASTEIKMLGIFFTLINYFIARFFLSRTFDLFKNSSDRK